MTRAIVAAALALAACWRDDKPTAPKPPPPSPCTTAVSAMLDAMHDRIEPATRDKLHAAFVERCTSDGWSQSAIACLAAGKTHDDVRRCGEMLTEDQRERSERAAREIDPSAGKTKRKLDEGVDPVVRVFAIEPDRGDPSGGTYVKISGNRFACGGTAACRTTAKVYFGSRQGTVVRIASDRELVVEAPGGRAGDVVDVLVIVEPGGEVRLPRAFTYVAATAP